MVKTIKVRVNIRQMHPIYKKVTSRILNYPLIQILNVRKNYLVHDEGELCTVGDIVRIESCRPLSARKSFALAEILHKKNLGPLAAMMKKK